MTLDAMSYDRRVTTVALRPAEPGDVHEVAGVHVRAWQAAYRGLLPDDFLDGLRPEDRAARYTFGVPDAPYTVVAVDDRAICGFVTTGPASEDTHGAGHLIALYVDPSHWGRRIGQLLVATGRDTLAAAGYPAAVLWTLAGNERAERFYLRDGWTTDGAVIHQRVWGLSMPTRRYDRPL